MNERYFDTMYLKTVNDKFMKTPSSLRDYSLNVKDIEGAQANTIKSKLNKNSTLPSNLQTSDILGAQPQHLTHAKSSPDRTLHVDDIKGTRPMKNCTFSRSVNPLNPTYKLPSVNVKPQRDEMRYYRETNKLDDIDGTRTRVTPVQSHIINNGVTRMLLASSSSSTSGSSTSGSSNCGNSQSALEPGSYHYTMKKISEMRREGVSAPKYDFLQKKVTRRVTNPQSPRYKYDTASSVNVNSSTSSVNVSSSTSSEPAAAASHKLMMGEIKGSHPKPQPLQRRDRPMLSLVTEDLLQRAKPNYAPHQINNVHDIEGARPHPHYATFHKASNRKTDPLNPRYEK